MATEFSMYTLSFYGDSKGIEKISDNDSESISNSEIINDLNNKAHEVAKDIEDEVSRVFRGSVGSQVELRFYEGSIVVQGTILLISWVGPIALAATRKAIENQLTKLVEISIRRVLQRHFQTVAPRTPIEPMRQMTVTLETAPDAPRIVESSGSASVSTSQNLSPLLYLILIVNSITMLVLILFVVSNI